MQEDEFDFQIEPLPLAEYATVALASQICDRYFSNIIKRLQQNGELPRKNLCSNLATEKTANKIRMEISETLSADLNYLPEIIKTKIRTKALELIGVLYDWITFLMRHLGLDVIYLDKIYWTPTGNIDVEKIFMLSWINIHVDEMTRTGWFSEKFSPLNCLACFFAQEQFISDFQADIIREIKDIFPWFTISKNSNTVFRIISIVIFCYDASENSRDLASIEADEVNERNLSAITMLNICRSLNFDKAYVYFFNFLKGSEELNLLDTASQTYFGNSHPEMGVNEMLEYRLDSRFQIKIFLLKKMNNSQKCNLILEDLYFLFLSFLQKGYFRKYCIPLLDTFLIHNATMPTRLRSSIHASISAMEIDRFSTLLKNVILIIRHNVIDLKLDYFFYIDLLEFFMKKIPKNIKFEVITYWDSDCDKNIMQRIYKQFCVPVMKVIMNDHDLQAQKIEMINYGKKRFRLLIEEKKYEDLAKFKTEILTSKTDEDAFDQIFLSEILKSWIFDGRFDFVDNYLTWKYGDQARLFKINLYPLWCSFISKNYTDIKELLMWCFRKQEMPSLNNCQLDNEILFLKQFCQELVYNIWFRTDVLFKDVFPAANLSNKILAAVLVSQNEIENFKKNYLTKDDSCIRFFCTNEAKKRIKDKKETEYYRWRYGRILKEGYLYYFESQFEGIDEFFNFCGTSPIVISAIKQSIADNVTDWIIICGVGEHYFKVVAPLLDWVNGEKVDNCEILKTYVQNQDKVDLYYRKREEQNNKNKSHL